MYKQFSPKQKGGGSAGAESSVQKYKNTKRRRGRCDVTAAPPHSQHGSWGCHCGQVGVTLGDTGGATKCALVLHVRFVAGLRSQGVAGRPRHVLQRHQDLPEHVSEHVSEQVLRCQANGSYKTTLAADLSPLWSA